MAKKCSICGKKFGFFEGKIILLDGIMCTSCWQIGGLGNNSQAMYDAMYRTVDEMKSIRAAIEEKFSISTSIEVSGQTSKSRKMISWEEFHKHFLKWSRKERQTNLGRLAHFGNTEEVFEVCIWTSANAIFLNMFVEKAFKAGVRFSPHQVLALLPLIKQPLRNQIAEFANEKYTKKQLEKLEGQIEYGVLYRILRNHGVKFEQLHPWEDEVNDHYEIYTEEEEPEFWETFFSADAESVRPSKKTTHDGRCDGNCANCPPHYGYRHGRWYYGHNHIEHCEFGGNRGGITWEIQKKRLEQKEKKERMHR